MLESYLESFKVYPLHCSPELIYPLESYLESFKVDCLYIRIYLENS